jgi:tetratricopeptide (TPR) repeat protein
MTTQAATPATEGQVQAYTSELLARLGVGPGASMGEIERAHDQRLDFLAQAPAEMSDWAHHEIGRVDEAYALLTDPHADIPAAAAAALADRGGAHPAPEAPLAATAAPPAPRMAHSTKVLLLVALAAAVIFGVYKWGGDSGVPAISGQPTDSSSAAAAPQLDTAKVGAAMQKISANPKDVAALKELGDLYFQAGDYPTAIEWESKALEIEPQDVTALLALGAAQFNSGDSEGAKANWKKVVKIDSRNAEAHYDLGFLALSVEPVDMDTAKAEWQKVVDIDPKSELAKSVSTHLEGLAKQGETATK